MDIVRLKPYERAIKRLKIPADDIIRMENAVADNPLVGDVIVGLSGVRKARFRIGDRGKSGGGRVIYYAVLSVDRIYFIAAYRKGDKEDLSPDEKRAVKALVKTLAGEVRREQADNPYADNSDQDESDHAYGKEGESG